jgi:integrase
VLGEFCRNRVEPWAKAQFERTCPANWRWYRARLRAICAYETLANLRLDAITSETATDFARHEMTRPHMSHVTRGKKRNRPKTVSTLAVSTVNTSLRALRRVLRLAVEWGVIAAAPKIKVLPGEQHRDRVISQEEEVQYLAATEEPLGSIAAVLTDTGLRPDECYRLRWEHISFEDGQYRYGSLSVMHGKTKAARRKLPLSARVRGVLEMLWVNANKPETGWIFPSATKTGHADHATIRKQHLKALKVCGIRPFVLYSLRHTFLTRLGASGCDVWTLARVAGHSSIQMSAKYVHPSEDAILTAMARLPEPKTPELNS